MKEALGIPGLDRRIIVLVLFILIYSLFNDAVSSSGYAHSVEWYD
jgi:hypothetical protein